MEPSRPRSLCPLRKYLDPHSDVLHILDDRGKLLRSGNPIRSAYGYDRRPAPADQYRLPTCAETGDVCVSGGPVLACSKSCNHECRDHHCCIADMGVRDDVAGRLGGLGILYVNADVAEHVWRTARLPATARTSFRPTSGAIRRRVG
jgi:hypothetical protein